MLPRLPKTPIEIACYSPLRPQARVHLGHRPSANGARTPHGCQGKRCRRHGVFSPWMVMPCPRRHLAFPIRAVSTKEPPPTEQLLVCRHQASSPRTEMIMVLARKTLRPQTGISRWTTQPRATTRPFSRRPCTATSRSLVSKEVFISLLDTGAYYQSFWFTSCPWLGHSGCSLWLGTMGNALFCYSCVLHSMLRAHSC